jgi:hypothetical protein
MPAPGIPFRLSCVAGIEGDVGVTVAIAPNIHVDNPNADIEGRQNSATSPQETSKASQAKAGRTRRWLSGAMLGMLEFFAAGVLSTGGR